MLLRQRACRGPSIRSSVTQPTIPAAAHRPRSQQRAALRAPSPRAAGTTDAAATTADEEDLIEAQADAFEQLVKMALDKDPSLAPLAEQHLKAKAQQQQKRSSSSGASIMLGPSLNALPNSSKPPWLRQRAPQGERYGELFSQVTIHCSMLVGVTLCFMLAAGHLSRDGQHGAVFCRGHRSVRIGILWCQATDSKVADAPLPPCS